MKTVLRILIIEDSEDDALLVLNHIKKGGYDIEYERVETAETMKTALKEKAWDIVLSDYKMPRFNGLEALTLLQESGIDIPFIVISGAISEDVAVETMTAGAQDYMMKNNLQRLLPAIERELRESKIRAERKLLEQKVEQDRLTNLRFFESLDRVNLAIQGTNDIEQMMSDVLDAVLSIFDCDRAFLMYPCDPEAATWRVPMERNRPEYPGVLALGLVMPMTYDIAANLRILLDSAGPVQFGPGTEHPLPAEVSERFGFKSFMSIALRPKLGKPWQFGIHHCSYPRIWTPDEEKLLQEISRRLSDGLTSLLAYRDLQENERKLRYALQVGHIGAFAVDIESGRGTFTPDLAEFWGMPGDFTGDFLSFCWEHLHPEELPGTKEAFARMVQSRKEGEMEFRIIRPDGELRWLHWRGQVIQDAAGGPLRAVGVNIDITERKRAEEALRQLNESLEQRVNERTAELAAKNADLERINRLFVGRELRMVELKEKIRELEKEVQDKSGVN